MVNMIPCPLTGNLKLSRQMLPCIFNFFIVFQMSFCASWILSYFRQSRRCFLFIYIQINLT